MTQYTIRQVPERLDERLRRLARERDTSLNQVVVDLLSAATGLSDEPVLHHDLDDLIGTWVEDPAVDQALAAFETVDEELWR